MSIIKDALERESNQQGNGQESSQIPPPPKKTKNRKKRFSPLVTALLLLVITALLAAAFGMHFIAQIKDSFMRFFADEEQKQSGRIELSMSTADQQNTTTSNLVTSTNSAKPSDPDTLAKSPEKQKNPLTPKLFDKSDNNSEDSLEWPELELSGCIIISSGNDLAIINNKTLGSQDSISGVKIMQIRENTVRVKYKGETRILRASPK